MSRCRSPLPALLFPLVLGLPGRAEPPPVWPLPPAGTYWYRITLLGQPSGYMSSSVRLGPEAQGEEFLEIAERQVIAISLGGQTLRVTQDLVTRYARDLSPVRWSLRLDKLGQLQEVTARREGTSLHIVSTEGGQRREEIVPLPADFSSELQVFAAVVKGELQPGQSRTHTTFLPVVSALDTETITVGEPEMLQVQGQPQRTFPLRVVARQVGSEVCVWINEQGEVVKYSLPALMGALVESVSQAEALQQLAPLVLTNTIPLDQPLPASKRLQRLNLEVKGLGQDPTILIPATPRQQVTAGPEGTARVTIQAQTRPTQTVRLPLSPEGREEYLRATPMAQSDDPRLRELAQQAIGTRTDAYEAALALNDWVYRHLGKMDSEPRPITALQVLDQGKGDCSEHALLMATLARAIGLPSRLVAGLAAIGDKLFYHAWVEVYVGEWVEMDPTWNEPGVDAGHLLLARSAMDEVSYARMSLETGRTLGAMTVSVLEHQEGP